MTFKELLKITNFEDIWNSYFINYYSHKNYSHEKISILKKTYFDIYLLLLQKKEKLNKTQILIIFEARNDFSISDKTFYIDSSLYEKEKLLKIDISEELISQDIFNKFSFVEMNDYFKNLYNPIPSAYFTCSWDEILGYEISKTSVELYGNSMCAAAILFELTFCGFEESSIEKFTNKIKEFSLSEKNIYEQEEIEEFISDTIDTEKELIECMKISFENIKKIREIQKKIIENELK